MCVALCQGGCLCSILGRHDAAQVRGRRGGELGSRRSAAWRGRPMRSTAAVTRAGTHTHTPMRATRSQCHTRAACSQGPPNAHAHSVQRRRTHCQSTRERTGGFASQSLVSVTEFHVLMFPKLLLVWPPAVSRVQLSRAAARLLCRAHLRAIAGRPGFSALSRARVACSRPFTLARPRASSSSSRQWPNGDLTAGLRHTSERVSLDAPVSDLRVTLSPRQRHGRC